MEFFVPITLSILILLCALVAYKLFFGNKSEDNSQLLLKLDALITETGRIEKSVKEEIALNRVEQNNSLGSFQKNFIESLTTLSSNQLQQLNLLSENNQQALQVLTKTIGEKLDALTSSTMESNRQDRDELAKNIKEFSERTQSELVRIAKHVEDRLTAITEQTKSDNVLQRDALVKAFKDFQEAFDKNVKSFNDLQREKFGQLEIKQGELIQSTEKRLEEMRATVDEKLQKTLNERLGQSFELVGKQLESVQKGLGEMQTLAQDVGGLKKVLSNVKMRGGIGEVQLQMLLEQILAPDQYEANVKTKRGEDSIVEYAIKLPGRDEANTTVWLPIDAKFPKDVYEQLQTAYDTGDLGSIELAQKNLEGTIKKMAKDISEKYLNPPNTTDFGIMFLPFEGIYAEVVRKASLLEELQRTYKIVVTGPATLAAILNSLQMGFRTLAIQKRSSEVWQVLGAVKKEFENFGGLLEKAQKNLHTASDTVDELLGKRTRAINRKLKGVTALNESDAKLILPEANSDEILDDEN